MHGSRSTALVQLFPEIGLDIRKFPTQPRILIYFLLLSLFH